MVKPKYNEPGHDPYVAPETLADLSHEYGDYLRNTLRGKCLRATEDEIDDLLVDGLIKALRNREKYDAYHDDDGRPRPVPVRYATYLCKPVIWNLQDRRRKAGRRPLCQSLLEGGIPLEEIVDHRERVSENLPIWATDPEEKRRIRQNLVRSASRLSDDARQLFLLLAAQTLNLNPTTCYDSIAERLHISTRTLYRRREKIREQLGIDGREAILRCFRGEEV